MRSTIVMLALLISSHAQAMTVDTVCYKPDVIRKGLGIAIMIKTNNMDSDSKRDFRGALVDFIFARGEAKEYAEDMTRLGMHGEFLENSGILDSNSSSQHFYSDREAPVGLDLAGLQVVTEKDLLSHFNGGQIGKYELRATFIDDVAKVKAGDQTNQFGEKMIEVTFLPSECKGTVLN